MAKSVVEVDFLLNLEVLPLPEIFCELDVGPAKNNRPLSSAQWACLGGLRSEICDICTYKRLGQRS